MARSITHKDGNRTGNRLFASAVSRSTQSLLQFDRLLGASLHAEATAPAGIRVKNKRLLSAVDEQLQPPQHWEFSFLLRRNGPDDENVVRTNWNARSFCLAAHGVDDRHHNTRIKFAVWVRFCHLAFSCLAVEICHDPHLLPVAQSVIQPGRTPSSAWRPGSQRSGVPSDALYVITFQKRRYCGGDTRIVPAAHRTGRRRRGFRGDPGTLRPIPAQSFETVDEKRLTHGTFTRLSFCWPSGRHRLKAGERPACHLPCALEDRRFIEPT
jgi:hypothetical protein